MQRASPQVLVLQVYEPQVLAKHKPDPSPTCFSTQIEKTKLTVLQVLIPPRDMRGLDKYRGGGAGDGGGQ